MTIERRFAAAACVLAVWMASGCGGGGGGGVGGGGGGGGVSGGGLSLSSDSVAFSQEYGDPLPAAQTVDIAVDASGVAYVAAGVPPGTQKPDWLDLTISGSGSTWHLRLSILNGRSSAGTVSVTVRVGIGRADQSVIAYRDMAVSYTVAPGISPTVTSLSFRQTIGSSVVPAAQNLYVNGTSGVALAVAVDQPWVTVTGASGSFPVRLQVGVDPTGLAEGTYHAVITLTGGTTPRTVDVVLTVAFARLYVVYPVSQAIAITTTSGSSGILEQIELGIDTGTNAYPWTVTSPPWLTLSPASGTVSSPIFVGVKYDATTLPPGTYTSSVDFSADVNGRAATISLPVTLTVNPPALRAWAEATRAPSVTIAATSGRVTAATSIALQLNSTVPFPWTATAPAWLHLSQSSGTVGSTPISLSVTADATTLAPGTYAVSVDFSAQVNGVTVTTSLPVTCTVAAPALTTSAAAVALGGASGHDVGVQLVNLALDSGATLFGFTAAASDPWLEVSPTSGSLSSTPLTISVAPSLAGAGLAAGTYTGSVTVTANVNGSPVTRTIPVTMTLDDHKLLASDVGVALASTPTKTALTRTLRLRTNRGLPARWTASSDHAWLSVTASGTTADGLVLAATPAGLATDALHEATVTVASPDPGIGNTEQIHVGLWVSSASPSTLTVATSYAEVAADPVRPYAYVHGGGTAITIYNTITGAPVATISGVGTALGAMAASLDGSRLFVVDAAADGLHVVPVDLATRTPGTPWALGAVTGRAALAYARSNGVGLLLASDGSVRSASTGAAHAATFSTRPVLSASRDGSRACALSSGPGGYSLGCAPIDFNGGSVAAVVGPLRYGQFNVGVDGHDVALSPDGTRAYVAAYSPPSFSVYDTTVTSGSMPVVKSLDGGNASPTAVEVGWDGRIYCGAAKSGTTDLWAYDAAYTLKGLWTLTPWYSIVDRQLTVSGDRLQIVALTDQPALVFLSQTIQ